MTIIRNLYDRPSVPLLVSIISGITAGSWFPGHSISIGIFSLLGLVSLIPGVMRRKALLILPLILFFSMGYLSIQSFVSNKFPPNHIFNHTGRYFKKITGVVVGCPVRQPGRTRFILRVESVAEKTDEVMMNGKIRVTAVGEGLPLCVGDRVTFAGKIREIRNFNNPGGFDYKRYMAFKGIHATSYTKAKLILPVGKISRKKFRVLLERLRENISTLIDRTGNTESGGVLKALVIGDRGSITGNRRDEFNRAGVGHLLAISGLHIGIVAFASFYFFNWLLSRFSFFLWRAWSKKGAVLPALLPVLVYGFLAGMTPSTQRAVIMVTVFLLTYWIERENDLINTLAVAALIILVFHPPSLFSISFQLSFSAVFWIIYGLSKLPGDLFAGKFLWDRLFKMFMVSGLAIIGTLPLVMHYFNQVSLIGIFSNMVLIPLIGFLVVPAGLLAVFAYLFSNTFALWVMQAAAFILEQGLKIIGLLANLPFASVKTVTLTPFEICCYYLLIWGLLNLGKKPEKQGTGKQIPPGGISWLPPFHRPDKRIAGNLMRICRGLVLILEGFARLISNRIPGMIAVVLAFVLITADSGYWLRQRIWHKELRVTVFDVGQGTSTLVELPGGSNLLIDGGGFSDNKMFDMGRAVIAPVLWGKKIKTVDTLILSHPNADHLNGLIYIAENFNVQRLLTNGETSGTKGYRELIKVAAENEIDMPLFSEINRESETNGVKLEILYPVDNFLDKARIEKWRNTNNNSMVVKISFGGTSFLFPGDIMSRAERELAALGTEGLRSTVLVAPHHGSRTSSSGLFLANVKPEYAIFSSGWKNRFKFPHPSVLDRYRKNGIRILRTDKDGAVMLSTDGTFLNIETVMANIEIDDHEY